MQEWREQSCIVADARLSSAIFLSLLLLIILSLPVSAAAVPSYASKEVVLNPGPIGAWDQLNVTQPTVIAEGGMFKMWYVGADGLTTGIGHAVSRDGSHWTYVTVDALEFTGSWMSPIFHPCVLLRPGGGYVMWFSGDLTGGEIGVANSTDGIRWTDARPILQKGVAGDWDSGGVGEPTVVSTSSGYVMWYVGVGSTGANASIGVATSMDGFVWQKYSANPVLTSGHGAWDADGLEGPSALVNADGSYSLWFAGREGQSARIAWASSSDGVTWWVAGVVLDKGENATADGNGATHPAVLHGGRLWYAGSDGVTSRILMAVEYVEPPISIATPTNSMLAILAGAGIVGMGAFVTSDRFKYAFFAIPLVLGKYIKNKKLDPFVRGQIYQYIRENPGDNYSSIMKGTGASNGNLAYHLHILVNEGFIQVVKNGRHVCFYPEGVPIPKNKGIRFSPLQIRILEAISRKPGRNQKSLSVALDIKKQTMGYNLWMLADEGVIEIKKIGRDSFLYISKDYKEEVEEL